MDSKVPVPTDNIYKFYALFSLLVFIFSLGALLYVNKTTNGTVFAILLEVETIKQLKMQSPLNEAKKAMLDKQLSIATSDRQFFTSFLGMLGGISAFGIYYGFRKWHREVQPVIDETARVQLEIAKMQMEKMRRELGNTTA